MILRIDDGRIARIGQDIYIHCCDIRANTAVLRKLASELRNLNHIPPILGWLVLARALALWSKGFGRDLWSSRDAADLCYTMSHTRANPRVKNRWAPLVEGCSANLDQGWQVNVDRRKGLDIVGVRYLQQQFDEI